MDVYKTAFRTRYGHLCLLSELGKEFVVYSNALHVGLGCVLIQGSKVVAYVSHQLKTYEIRDKQLKDESLDLRFHQVESGSTTDFRLNNDGTYGQSEGVIQILENMLRSCVVNFRGSWEDYPELAEFTYNNIFQSSIQMAPYEVLFGRKYRTPLCWTKLGECRVLGPELVSETKDKVQLIRDRLKQVGPIAYLLELPPELDRIHDVFYISMLKCYRYDPTHIVPIEDIEARPDLTFEEEPVQILDRDVKVLWRKSILLVKVLWQNHSTDEAT
ncbi:uncharacterized protein LOC128282161 [Gossypium arboreum]|uniref:uncharacterized protein LOC128282161 n=1 Tax=Gossypium arboreum TaxID=29729 RepID=UPI0022F1C84A|nr:uncharacterized protein LOC128282161 [Gossypium arboreum]